MNGTLSCCRGFPAEAQCALSSGSVDTCGSGFACLTNSEGSQIPERSVPARQKDIVVDARSSAHAMSQEESGFGKCISQESHQQIWIGVLLVLVGGATLNVGLNLQKYAFRKRVEKMKADEAAIEAAKAKAKAKTVSPSAPSQVFFYSTGAINGRTADRQSAMLSMDNPAKNAALSAIFPRSPSIGNGYGRGMADHGLGIRKTQTAHGRISEIFELQNVQLQQPVEPIPRSADMPTQLMHRPSWPRRLRSRLSVSLADTAFGSPIWTIGLVIFILGNVINFIALQFAPQSLVAPLGAVALVTNVIIAPLLNHEKIGFYDIGGILLIIIGCVVVVVFSGIVQQDYRLCVLIQLLKAKSTVIYLCLIFAAIIAVYLFLRVVEKGTERYNLENIRLPDDDMFKASNAEVDNGSQAVADAQTPRHGRSVSEEIDEIDDSLSTMELLGELEFTQSPLMSDANNWATLHEPTCLQKSTPGFTEVAQDAALHGGGDTKVQKAPASRAGNAPAAKKSLISRASALLVVCHPLAPLDKHIPPIHPDSRKVKYGLPLAYASLGSLMASLTTLFAKSLVNLLSVSFFEHDNQFTSFISWVILMVTAFTAASQVYWINQGLLRYDALLQVPVFYVVWTVLDIVGGGVYFNEFKLFTTVKYALFAVGVTVIFSGVGLLSHRMKRR
ncbi:hypothetical protein EC988_003059 [Linderina pennispora]|nr:hypothetical protein EC988_003059 [Linderina pennispora]